jgi:type IV fimbrial biogenesis protein FimT
MRFRHMTPSRRECVVGLTLVELLVVIAIVAILAAVGVPSFIDLLQNSRTRGATDTLAASMRAVQAEATKRNRLMTLAVQGSGTSTWCWGVVEGGTACNCSTAPAACVVDGGSTVTTSDGFSGVAMSATDATFGFNPVRNTVALPTSTAEGSVTFSALNRSGRVVVTTGGQIRMCSPSGTLGAYPTCSP